jgi:two-component sensor histidine kinase/PAS domain-containing protein
MKQDGAERHKDQGRTLFFVLVLSIVAVAAFGLIAGYRSVYLSARERVVVSAQSYGEYVHGVLSALDISTDVVVREVLDGRNGEELREYMRRQVLFVPQIETLEYYDPDGTFLVGVPETSVEISQSMSRDLLTLHRDAWVETSVSLAERVDRIRVTRSVVGDDGFEGLVVATVPQTYFYQAIPHLFPTAVAQVILANAEGDYLLHWGNVDNTEIPAIFDGFDGNEGTRGSGGVSIAATPRFLGVTTQLRSFPLRVTLSFDRSVLMADWETQLDYTLVILGLFVVAGLIAYRYIRRLQRRQASVREQLLQERESRKITELIRRVRDQALAADGEAAILQGAVCELSRFLGATEAQIHAHGDSELPPTDLRLALCGVPEGVPHEGPETVSPPRKGASLAHQLRLPIRVGSKNVGEVEFYLSGEPTGWHSQVAEQALTVVGGALLRNRIEGRLRDTEARLSAFMNNSPSINFVRDSSGTFVYANPEFRRVFGGPDCQIAESPAFDPSPEDAGEEVVVRKHEVPVDGEARIFSTRVFRFADSWGNSFTGGVGLDITEMQRTQQELKKALADKELLLREIHHRVKNNLAVIDSLLCFEQEKATPRRADEILSGVRSRIQAIALIHKRLYKSENLTGVPFREYSEELIDYILQTIEPMGSGETEVKLNIENTELDIDIVKPLGLILHELVANAVKYAPGESDSLRLEVSFGVDEEGRHALEVRDYGPGFEKEPVPDPEISLGYFVVHALCDELGAELATWNDDGAHIRVRLPVLG